MKAILFCFLLLSIVAELHGRTLNEPASVKPVAKTVSPRTAMIGGGIIFGILLFALSFCCWYYMIKPSPYDVTKHPEWISPKKDVPLLTTVPSDPNYATPKTPDLIPQGAPGMVPTVIPEQALGQ
jgi:hypothetical protein